MTKEQAIKIAQRLRYLHNKSKKKDQKKTGQIGLDFSKKN